jgi:hypothetical protein
VLPLTLVIGAGVAVPLAQADPSDSTATSATIVLRTPVGAADLAQTGGLTRAARLSRLHDTMPSAAAQTGVLSAVRSLGLTVDAATAWSISVHGSPGALHRLSLLPEVSDVVLAGGPAPASADAVPVTGPQLRSAYTASSAAPPASAAKPIVATVQFGPWDSTELSGYVTNANALPSGQGHQLPAVPAGEFTAISADGAATTPGAGGFGGSGEVALDQESLYATDPYALQRAYFASGSPAGLVAALDKVAADALTMPSLVALSLSWTWCELTLNFNDVLAIHNALANVVAAGVTVFAASGDDGSFCNGSTTVSVAYPASDPYVIAVGGTTLDLVGPKETGWEVVDHTRASGIFGSGGGQSMFPFPSWQAAISDSHREVPDIAADGDLNSGFYSWFDDGDGTGVGWHINGGTSLSVAASAGLYAAELGSRGATNGGLGDLHTALYSAPAGTFRDITSSPSVVGQFSATAGYDLVTGLGAPLWGKVVDRLLTQPVISVPATLTTRVVPVTVTAPAGQTFIAWTTGFGNPPAACGTPTGQPSSPAAVTVPTDGSFRIWAVGYVGAKHCFIVSTTTVVNTGSPPPPPTTTPPTTTHSVAPTTTHSVAPTTTPPVAPTTTPPALPTTTLPPIPVAPPFTTPPAGVAPPTQVLPVTDVTPPSVTLLARRTSPGTSAITYTWAASDGSGSGISSVAATLFRDGLPTRTTVVKASGKLTIVGDPGHSYSFAVVATDVAGNAAGFGSNTVRLPYDDRSFTLSKTWSRSKSHAAFEGSYVKSAAKGASASIKAVGKTFSLLTETGPAEGIVGVSVDGHHVRDVSLFSKSVRSDVTVVLARFKSAGTHRITLTVRGTHAAHATGVTVPVDGLLAS